MLPPQRLPSTPSNRWSLDSTAPFANHDRLPCLAVAIGDRTTPMPRRATATMVSRLLPLEERLQCISIGEAEFVPMVPFLRRALSLFRSDVGIAQSTTSSNPILQSNLSTAQVWPRRAAIFLRHGDGKGTPGHVSCRPSWGASRSKTTSDAQSSNGSFTNIVSSRSGLVDSSVTGHSISSSMWRTYFTACAGSSLHLRAPFVDCDQPSRHS